MSALSERYALKVLLNPHDASTHESHESSCSSGSGSMSNEDIERLFKSEYDLPCQPHQNVVRVFHHFCDRVEKEGTSKNGGMRLSLYSSPYRVGFLYVLP